jgi:hypothetical protein
MTPANATAAAPTAQTAPTAQAAQTTQTELNAPTAQTAETEQTEQIAPATPDKPEIFGPEDWDMIHVNPRHVEHGARVRPVRSGDDGLTKMYNSIKLRWDVLSTVVLWRDPEHEPGQAPRYFCVDGMHRVCAVIKLLDEGHSKWPRDWLVSETGEVQMICAVLKFTPDPEAVVGYALQQNALTSTAVETTQIDILHGITAARKTISAKHPSMKPTDQGYQTRVLGIAGKGLSHNLTERSLRKDVRNHIALSESKTLSLVLDTAQRHGHGWFSRNGFNALVQKQGFHFAVSLFVLWLEKGKPEQVQFADSKSKKIKVFNGLAAIGVKFYADLKTLCQDAHGDHRGSEEYCLRDEPTLERAREAILSFAEYDGRTEARVLDEKSVLTELETLIGARTLLLFPSVPRSATGEPTTATREPSPSPEARSPRPRATPNPPAAIFAGPGEGSPFVSLDPLPLPRLDDSSESEIQPVRRSAVRRRTTADSREVADTGSARAQPPRPDAGPPSPPRSGTKRSAPANADDADSAADAYNARENDDDDNEVVVVTPRPTKRARRGRRIGGKRGSTNSRGDNSGSESEVDDDNPFDDDSSAPLARDSASRSPIDPTDGDNSEEFVIPLEQQHLVPAAISHGSALNRRFRTRHLLALYRCRVIPAAADELLFLSDFYTSRLTQVGYAIIPDAIRDAGSDFPTVLARIEMDLILDFSKRAFKNDGGKCCSHAPKPAFAKITNSFENTEAARLTSMRYQSERESFHQHLEERHGVMFEIKLKLDLAAALLLRDLGMKEHSLPDTGGRLLLSEPGCTAQPPHTDYAVRYTESGGIVRDCSYFVMFSGREGATILVWPGSHHTAATFQRYTDMLVTDRRNASLLIKNSKDLNRMEEAICGELKPQRVTMQPYSAFIGRGDLVHAGDAHAGPEPHLRTHVHVTASQDKVLNIIGIRPFGV